MRLLVSGRVPLFDFAGAYLAIVDNENSSERIQDSFIEVVAVWLDDVPIAGHGSCFPDLRRLASEHKQNV
jgi:hypothetical protein